jgi:hypothetical protein
MKNIEVHLGSIGSDIKDDVRIVGVNLIQEISTESDKQSSKEDLVVDNIEEVKENIQELKDKLEVIPENPNQNN